MMQMPSGNWCTFTSSIWAIIVILSQARSETFDFTKCDISENFQSELVSASFKSLEAGQGCETNGTTARGQEVHVISVTAQDSDDKNCLTVRLNIHSRRQANHNKTEGVDFKEEARSVIFILHSHFPARWQVEMYGINSQEKHLFVLSKESLIRFQRKRTKLMARVHKNGLPFSDNSSFISDWVQRRFGAVTSYSEISETQVKFYVGRDISAGQYCDLDAKNSSHRMFSYRESNTPITGCVSKRRNHHVRAKPVYIIELLEPPAHSPGVKGVDLEIMPYYSGKSTRSKGQSLAPDKDWKFYLVVRSPPHLQWTLHSKKLSGSVDIVVDASADVKVRDVKINTVALRADVMQVTGKQLVEWSQEYIAPVQMYAGIHAANTIKLRVPLTERSIASTRDGVAISNNINREQKMEREGMSSGGYEQGKADLQGNLNSFIQITCTEHGMEVKISKLFFQRSGFDDKKVSLKDPSCQPIAETNDHIILCTGLHQCGTQSMNLSDMSGNTSFTNAVVIEILPSHLRSFLQEEKGSGFFDNGDAGGGGGGGDNDNEAARISFSDVSLFLDDEDFSPDHLNIPVECVLPTATVHPDDGDYSDQLCKRGGTEPQPSASCSMNLYATASFQDPREEFPALIDRNSTFYVKAVLLDQNLTILVDSCWLSTSSLTVDGQAEIKRIITHGCTEDVAVSWVDDPSTTSESGNINHTQFKVIISDHFGSYSPLYLHCHFHLCQQGNHELSDKCSTDGHVHCLEPTPAMTDHSHNGADRGCGPLTIGPFHLVDKESLVKPSSGDPDVQAEMSTDQKRSHQQRVIIEGLDSATVVGIAFAAFAIGIVLMAALWFIHSHTGPKKQRVSVPREPDVSADLTPNSSSPMTA